MLEVQKCRHSSDILTTRVESDKLCKKGGTSQWMTLRVLAESTTLRYPDKGSHAHMHTEVS